MGDGTAENGSRWIPVLVVAAYTALIVAWAITNPPFAAPDEPDHYLRSVGLAGGQLIGERADYPTPADAPRSLHRVYELYEEAARRVRVPAGLWANGLTCNAFAPGKTADCLDGIETISENSEQLTLVSAYPPAPYFLPGVLARLGDDPFTALRLGRLGSAFVCLCFLTLAVLLLWGRDPIALSLVGLVAAITPMVVFTAASLNPSGPEILSSVAFIAALIRLSRGGHPAGWVWAAAAASGAALAVSRSPGPVWIAFDCAAVLALTGIGRARAVVDESRRAASLAAAGVVAAVLANVAWQAAYGPPSSVGAHDLVRSIRPAIASLPAKFAEQVGVFGWLDAPMPSLAVLAWQGLVVAVLTTGLLVGGVRARWVIVAGVAGTVTLTIGWAAWYRALAGIDGQGRHWLPIAVAVPLIAGEVIYQNRDRLGMLNAQRLFLPVVSLAGLLQVVGWYSNARRHAQGVSGRLLFFESPAWSPPLGWFTWGGVVAAAFLLLVIAGATAGGSGHSRLERLTAKPLLSPSIPTPENRE
jgi:hypothetical protein